MTRTLGGYSAIALGAGVSLSRPGTPRALGAWVGVSYCIVLLAKEPCFLAEQLLQPPMQRFLLPTYVGSVKLMPAC